MKRLLIMTILLLSFTSSISQENSMVFSLEEAIEYALANNRTAINAQRDIDAAKRQKWETTATGLPQINASVDYQNFLKQPISLIPAEFFGGNPGEFAEVVFGTNQNMNATATIEQLLFDGSYIVGLQSAKVFLEISKNAKIKTDLEIRKAIINAYGNVLLAEESVKITENNKAVLEQNLDETQKIYENGLTEEENVEQLQITLLQLDYTLKNAERLRDIAYKLMNITLGLELSNTVTLSDNLESLATQSMRLDLLTASVNLNDNIDYKIAENNKKSSELLLKLEKSKALPRLNAFVNGGYTGYSNSFEFLQSDQQWFGSSLMGVSLDIPIFSSLGRSSATQRAKINLEKAKTDLTETEQNLKFEITTAKSNYEFALESYKTAKQNLALAERIEKKNQTKFFEGIASSFELRQAQTQLFTAQREYLQAMLNVINNKTELETVLNQTSN